MRDADQALEELGRAIGLKGAEFDADGNLTLMFDGTLPINLAKLDSGTIEIWSPLATFGSPGDSAALQQALVANHLGEGTGAARLALQPHGGGFVLCERVLVASVEAKELESRFTDFVRYAFFWSSPEARSGDRSALNAASGTDESSFMIRA